MSALLLSSRPLQLLQRRWLSHVRVHHQLRTVPRQVEGPSDDLWNEGRYARNANKRAWLVISQQLPVQENIATGKSIWKNPCLLGFPRFIQIHYVIIGLPWQFTKSINVLCQAMSLCNLTLILEAHSLQILLVASCRSRSVRPSFPTRPEDSH